MINEPKTTSGDTWDTVDTSWNSEVGSWNSIASFITNTSVQRQGSIWSSKRRPWMDTTPWVDDSGMQNIEHAFALQWGDWETPWEDNDAQPWGNLSQSGIINMSKPI